jgi:hypothetical protein
LSPATTASLREAELTPDQWPRILQVAVGDQTVPMLGAYTIRGDAVWFTPAFPFDPGRDYFVRFDPSRIPGGPPSMAPPITATVVRPAEHRTPSTVVTKVYPSGDLVPENLLRIYVEFSRPMGRRSGIPHMTLLDERGEDIIGAFLPLDYEFWSPDHRRFTAFLDPGRVKDGILPNQQLGRALTPGGSVTLVISPDWLDEQGLPLEQPYRRTLRVGPAQTTPLDTAQWRLQPPAAGHREALVVTFPAPLDHGLLLRALGVRRDGAMVDGDIAVESGEARWRFIPRHSWRPGAYELIALDILEDVAGNQIGRAFEVDNFETVDKSPNPKTIAIPFVVSRTSGT